MLFMPDIHTHQNVGQRKDVARPTRLDTKMGLCMVFNSTFNDHFPFNHPFDSDTHNAIAPELHLTELRFKKFPVIKICLPLL